MVKTKACAAKKEGIEEKEKRETKNYIVQKFQKKFRKIKDENSWSEIADDTKISIETLKSYLRPDNDVLPTYEILLKLADAYGVTPDYLCGYYDRGENETDPSPYLKNLAAIIKKFNFKVSIEDNILNIICSDNKIVRLFEDALTENTLENDKEAKFLMFYDKLVSQEEFWNIKKNIYLFSHNIELPDENSTLEDYLSALQDAIRFTEEDDEMFELKLEEWENSCGYPKKYISDEYYDLIHKYHEYESYGK